MKLFLECTHTISSRTEIDLPEGYRIEDVTDASVKWGNYTLTMKDGTKLEGITNELSMDSIDHKYPDDANLFPADETGEYPDYGYKGCE